MKEEKLAPCAHHHHVKHYKMSIGKLIPKCKKTSRWREVRWGPAANLYQMNVNIFNTHPRIILKERTHQLLSDSDAEAKDLKEARQAPQESVVFANE